MINSKQTVRRITVLTLSALFVLLEIFLAVKVQTVSYSDFLRYAYPSIVLAFLFSFLSLVYSVKDGWLVRAGLLFTLGADYCLVVMSPAEETLGVTVFIFTQICYFLYILYQSNSQSVNKAHIITRIALSVISLCIPFLVLGEDADLLTVISVFYYAQLLTNLLFSFFNPRLRTFSVGLLLFALCDLSIGLDRLEDLLYPTNQGSFLYLVTHTGLNNSWIFYIPSQTLISFSLLKNSRCNNGN